MAARSSADRPRGSPRPRAPPARWASLPQRSKPKGSRRRLPLTGFFVRAPRRCTRTPRTFGGVLLLDPPPAARDERLRSPRRAALTLFFVPAAVLLVLGAVQLHRHLTLWYDEDYTLLAVQ